MASLVSLSSRERVLWLQQIEHRRGRGELGAGTSRAARAKVWILVFYSEADGELKVGFQES